MFRCSKNAWASLSKRARITQRNIPGVFPLLQSDIFGNRVRAWSSPSSTQRVVFKDALSGVRIQPSADRYKDKQKSRSAALYINHVNTEIAHLGESPSDWEVLLRQCLDDRMHEAAREALRAAQNKGIRLSEDVYHELFERSVGNYRYELAGDVLLELVPLDKASEEHGPRILRSDSVLDIISEKFRRNDISYLSRLLILILQHNRADIAYLLHDIKNEYDSGFVLRSQNNSSQFNHVSDLLGRALSELFTYTRSKGVVQQSLFRFFGLILDRSGVDADLVNKFISELNSSASFGSAERVNALGCMADCMSSSWELSAIDAFYSAVRLEWSKVHAAAAAKNEASLFPSHYERALMMLWSVAYFRNDAWNRENPEDYLHQLSVQCKDQYKALAQFIRSDSWALTFNVPAGFARRQFRILCDALGLYHRVLPNELATDLIRIKVYKEGQKERYERRDIIDPPGLDDLLTQHRFHEDKSPMRLSALPSDWVDAAMGLCSAQPDLAGTILARIFREVSRQGLSDASWALEWSKVLSRIDASVIPANVLGGIINMCKHTHDVYGLLEVLYICRERGVRLPSASWHASIETAWAAGLRHLPRENWSRAFIQVIDVLKQCNGKLDNPSIRVLMRYLTIKRDREDVFLYKIIDRLYKDHSQELNHIESTILTVLLFRRNPALKKSKILQIPQPMFTSSRFLTLHEHAHEKLYNMLFDQSKDLPEGFFHHFSSVWRSVHSSSGRADLFGIIHDLLFDPNIAYMISVPANADLRDAISHIAIFTAFQIAHHDKEYRKSFELLHRLSTLYREFELNDNKGWQFERDCPRREHPEEVISHFKYGWIEEDENGDPTEDFKKYLSDRPRAPGRKGSIGSSAGSMDEDVDEVEAVGEGEFLSRDDFATEEGFLRARAQKNAIRNPVRPIDVKKSDQTLRTDPYRAIERLGFIPKRS